MTDSNDFNRQVIDEFRANGGKAGGMFEGTPLLLLHHTGAKSGSARINPLVYLRDGDDYVIFASKAGAPTSPDWYHNLRANPNTTIEVGSESLAVTARVADGDERERLWSTQKSVAPQFAEYESKTDRAIPVVVLERA
ncbi:MAG: nitroreductase family deazaflavin-dependent oxidoreductase [Ilumatobacteraceae bacterium]